LYRLITWAKSNVEIDNENLLVASANDEQGEPAAYITCEPVFLLDSHAVSPTLTEGDGKLAGNAIDGVLTYEAETRGIGRFLIVIPDSAPPQPEERTLRFIEREAPQATAQRFDISAPTLTAYVN